MNPQVQLRWDRAASVNFESTDNIFIEGENLEVRKIQRRAVQSDGAAAPAIAKLRERSHAGPAELLERRRPQPGPGAGDQGLPRNPHRNAGSHEAEAVRQAAKRLAR